MEILTPVSLTTKPTPTPTNTPLKMEAINGTSDRFGNRGGNCSHTRIKPAKEIEAMMDSLMKSLPIYLNVKK